MKRPNLTRVADLEARRQALLHRCEEQRLELAYRVAQIGPVAQLTAWRRRRGAKGGGGQHPLAWAAGLASLAFFLRRRRVLSGVTGLTGLVALASRATTLLRLFAQFRAIYLGMTASRRRP